MSSISAYPLTWPEGWRRTPAGLRKAARFGKKKAHVEGGYRWKHNLTVNDGRLRLLRELDLLGVDDVVISTNLPVRLDGGPKANAGRPSDPGVAVYWREPAGDRRCIAIDIYDEVADNLAAVAATLDAMRAIERHGGAEILHRAFTGFVALPAPEQWWHVLGLDDSHASADQINAAYRRLAAVHHPDRGGLEGEMSRLNWARDQGLEQARRV